MSAIHCPRCGARAATKRAVTEAVFPWRCGSCRSQFEVRIVFFPREEAIDGGKFRAHVEARLSSQGLTRTELAKLVGVTPAYISTLLSGRRRVSKSLADRVLRALTMR